MINAELKEYCKNAVEVFENYRDEIPNPFGLLHNIIKKAKKDGIVEDRFQETLPGLDKPRYTSKNILTTLVDTIYASKDFWYYNSKTANKLIFGLQGGAWRTMSLKNPRD